MEPRVKVRYDLSDDRTATVILPKGVIVSLNGGTIQVQEEVALRVTFPESFAGQDVMKSDIFKVMRGPSESPTLEDTP